MSIGHISTSFMQSYCGQQYGDPEDHELPEATALKTEVQGGGILRITFSITLRDPAVEQTAPPKAPLNMNTPPAKHEKLSMYNLHKTVQFEIGRAVGRSRTLS